MTTLAEHSACGDCLALPGEECRPDCLAGVEQPARPGLVVATLFATSPAACDTVFADEPVHCRRCGDRLYPSRRGDWVACGEQARRCPAPAAAGGAHVPDSGTEATAEGDGPDSPAAAA